MHMKKVLSVRLKKELYTKVYDHEMKNSDLVSKALGQYFRQFEPNQTLDPIMDLNDGSAYVDLLKQTLNDKEDYIQFLQKEVESLTIMSMAKVPLLERIKMKLLSEKPE